MSVMRSGGIGLAGLLLLLGLLSAPRALADKVIGGTIQDIDRSGLQVILRTDLDLGETQILSVVLPVADATMMQGLERGDRVAVKLDRDGKVSRIVKTPEPKG